MNSQGPAVIGLLIVLVGAVGFEPATSSPTPAGQRILAEEIAFDKAELAE